jgi:hypothetical protein
MREFHGEISIVGRFNLLIIKNLKCHEMCEHTHVSVRIECEISSTECKIFCTKDEIVFF